MAILLFVISLLPILWMIVSLGALKWAGYKASFVAMVIAFVLAVLVFKMSPYNGLSAALEGVAMALWPIVVVIIAAVFLYNTCLHNGSMEVIKNMITGVSKDKRILCLLIAWCFGGFMEGMAGFGTAIAIPAGMLANLGFSPLLACLVCLIANGTPTPFGSIGIPTVTLANLVGLDSARLAFVEVLQLSPLILLSPFIMVAITGKSFKAIKGVFWITLASGLSFLLPELIVTYFVGAELAAVVGSIVSLLVTIMLAKIHDKRHPSGEYDLVMEGSRESLPLSKVVRSWLPFVLVFVFLLSTSILVKPVNDFLAVFKTSVQIYQGEGGTPYTFTWINTPGVWIFLAALIGAVVNKMRLADVVYVFKATVIQMSKTIITMFCVLATAKIMGYSGMINNIAGMFVMSLGIMYPLVAPLIGALGTFITGSGTSSSVLFGNVQLNAAASIGVDPYWMVALNSLGVAAGKMLAPQSIAIGLVAVKKDGEDGVLMKQVFPYVVLYVAVMAIVAFFGQGLIDFIV